MPPELKNAAYIGMGICGVMIVFNLRMARKRGVSRVFLAAAFATFGLIIFLFTRDGNLVALGFLGGITLMLLLADAITRAARKEKADQ